MTDPDVMLRRQAQWQKARCSLSWPEKIRMAEQVWESAERLRERPAPTGSTPKAPPGQG